MRFLLFTLYAPMGSFGEIAVGERRMSWARPGRSAVLGLVAAAQGIERGDEEAARRQEDRHGLFEIAEPKPFTPVLEPGDQLRFSLRANPVVRRRHASRRRSVKHDVVMDALRSLPGGERADHRLRAMCEQGHAWIERQGASAGFSVRADGVRVDGYDQHRITRRGAARPMSYSTLDFEGVLTLSDPGSFLSAIARGFGAAKSYGCGLKLIRRP